MREAGASREPTGDIVPTFGNRADQRRKGVQSGGEVDVHVADDVHRAGEPRLLKGESPPLPLDPHVFDSYRRRRPPAFCPTAGVPSIEALSAITIRHS